MAVCMALAAGCSTRMQLDANSSSGSGSVGLHIESESLARALIAGMFVAAAIDYQREPRPVPRISAIYDWTGSQLVPPLAPGRRVHEQDCSRPLEDPAANLKCR